MPIYTVPESVELLDQNRCGSCGGSLTTQPLRERISTPQGDATIDKGDTKFCAACKTFWPDDQIKIRREEAQRITEISGA